MATGNTENYYDEVEYDESDNLDEEYGSEEEEEIDQVALSAALLKLYTRFRIPKKDRGDIEDETKRLINESEIPLLVAAGAAVMKKVLEQVVEVLEELEKNEAYLELLVEAIQE